MSQCRSGDNLTRRKALKMLAGSAGAAVSFPILGKAAPFDHPARAAATGAAAAPKFFNPHQIQALAALSETIIPADGHSPGAKAARVFTYIDEVVAGADENLKTFWTQGLAAVDKLAELESGKTFAGCPVEQQVALMRRISENEDHPATLEERFFVALKQATIDGYYTAEIGIHKELEYQGNTALAEFKGCTHEHHKVEASEKFQG